jgi:hypothetical protein
MLPLGKEEAFILHCKCGVLIYDKAKTKKLFDAEFGMQMVCVTSGVSVFEVLWVLSGGLPTIAVIKSSCSHCVSHTCNAGARDEQSGGVPERKQDNPAFPLNYSLISATML